ncbi:Ribosomal L14e domain-containing protein [Citrus sinensis]|nr:Ribosomal L14e domain-containing protein [Citrus sinensis]
MKEDSGFCIKVDGKRNHTFKESDYSKFSWSSLGLPLRSSSSLHDRCLSFVMVVSPLICRGHFASTLIVARHHRPGDHQPLFFSFIIKIKDKKRALNEALAAEVQRLKLAAAEVNGRVALVNYGKDYGKLVVIVDVLDQNRALVDAPDMVRSQMNFKRLSLTDIKIDINRVPRKKSLIEAMEKADVKNKWENSSWGKKLIVQKMRAALNDFDKFKLMLAKIKKGGLIRQELEKLKKENAA